MPTPSSRSMALACASLILIFMTAACGSRHSGDISSGCQNDSDCDALSRCNTVTGFCEGQAVEPEPTTEQTPSPAEDTPDDNQDDNETDSDQAPEEPVEPTNPTLTITSPDNQASADADTTWNFSGTVTGVPTDEGPIDVTWSSGNDGIIHQEQLAADGLSTFTIDGLSNGIHPITFSATTAAGGVTSETIYIGSCGWELMEDFEGCPDNYTCQQTSTSPFEQWSCVNDGTDPNLPATITVPDETQWLTHRDAYKDCRGWLDMTGNVGSRKGAMFNIDQSLNPGNVKLRFWISTGQCPYPTTEDEVCYNSFCDADGFAASVYYVQTTEELEAVLNQTQTGGGLGYAIPSGGFDSFHIEFDTYHNGHDPHAGDHIAIMTNSDNATHHLVYPEAQSSSFELEDNRWHEIILEIKGTNITVDYDSQRVITGAIEGFEFKGGYIGFSGTTGYCYNYHRFDDLSYQPVCTFD